MISSVALFYAPFFFFLFQEEKSFLKGTRVASMSPSGNHVSESILLLLFCEIVL